MLKEGDSAPDFTTRNQNGDEIKLSDFRGKRVVLYFYPKDDTPGCTKEACSLRDSFDVFEEKGIKIFGVSNDDEKPERRRGQALRPERKTRGFVLLPKRRYARLYERSMQPARFI